MNNRQDQYNYNQNNYSQQMNNGFPPQGMKNNSEVNNLCMISLLLMYVFPITAGGITAITGGLTAFLSALIPLTVIAAYVLMIIARVKDPQNKFAKVLMIIYLVQIVLAVLLTVLSIMFMAVLIESCCGGLHGPM